jgi:amino acid adenylation domain-containing protein
MENRAENIENMAPERWRLVELLLKEQGIDPFQVLPIPHRRETGLAPLSSAQQRLWFINQLEPESPFYNIPAAFRLTGELNIGALEQSLSEIGRRHEALRTTFRIVEEQPAQVINPPRLHELPLIDLRSLPESERENQFNRLASDAAQRSFNLSEGPLMRASVLLLSEDRCGLLLNMHHIISDGWSLRIFIKELDELYAAFRTASRSPLSEPAIQYTDFSVWQQQWLAAGALEAQLNYWRQQLAGVSGVLELPADRPRASVEGFNGAARSFAFSPTLSEALYQLSREQRVTLFMTLLAAYQTLLYRYSGQADICVGTPVAGRNRTELEELIGFFVNTLVLRTSLSGNPSFRDLLDRTRTTALNAFANQDAPFQQIVEALQPNRTLNVNPLVQVMFTLQHRASQSRTLSGLALDVLESEGRTAKFDLSLGVTEEEDHIAGSLEYNTDLFEGIRIDRMLKHLEILLTGIVENPDQRIGYLPLLTQDECNQLLIEWNDTSRPYPYHLTLPQLFDAQVQRTPDAVAVVYDDQQLSYAELDQRSNQLAQHLGALGLGLEDRVALCLPRSLEMVVGMLAILKVGAAYVPLDPQYPSERLSFMLEDAEVSALLTTEALVERLPVTGVPLVRLDADWPLIARESTVAPAVAHHPQQLAYLIYTSGSTGTPKASGVSHRAILRLVCNSNYLQPRSTDCVAQASNSSFDAATFELWAPLLHGGRISGVQTQTVLAPLEFARWLYAQQVTTLFLTTALFNQMVREAAWGLRGVEQVLFGGQAVEPRWVAALLDQGYRGRLLHVYGPTEVTTFATWWEVREVAAEQATVPIGRALSNTSTYLLDEWQQPVGVGIEGELYLGGDGLARGYLGRAELTAERFVPDPFSARGGERLYRTGDICRWRWDGALEFSGRRDEQVKVRGYRIELGEIEVVLGRHEAVAAAAVVMRQEREGEQQLVGYLVWKDGAEVADVSEVRRWLREQVPDYMVPGLLVAVEGLPLTENGKVDRRQLAAWAAERVGVESGREYLEPRTAVEELVAGIWAEVLGVEQVGRNDNFFDLGGHSLLATQVMSRVRERLGVEVGLRRLFEEPTLEGLAATIEAALRASEGDGAGIEPLRAGARGELIPLSFAQQRLWFVAQLRPDSQLYVIPTAVRLSGVLNLAVLQQSFNEVVRRHEVLRTTIVRRSGQATQEIAPELRLGVRLVDVSGLERETQDQVSRRLGEEQAKRGFDLERLPLLRVTVMRLSEQEHILLLTMHHLIADDWSTSVFIRELKTHYQAFSKGETSGLPELQFQYADYAIWQRQWLQGEVLARQLEYWKQQLAGTPPVLELARGRARPPKRTFNSGRHSFMLSKSLSQQLSELSRREGVTLFMTLLAAYQTLLFRYSGQTGICVGTPIANRHRTELEGLIGYLVNILALRTDLSGNPSFKELLARVKEVAAGAYAHQDLPFESLVDVLRPERNLSYAPLVQVTFTFQNSPTEDFVLPRLTLTPMEIDSGTVEYDLSLLITGDAGGLGGLFLYNTDLFDAATVVQITEHFQTILEHAANDAEVKLLRIPISNDQQESETVFALEAQTSDGDDQFAFQRRLP